MKLTEYSFPEKEMKFGTLERLMTKNGFIHAEQWDYERVSFDYKILDARTDATYYLRVQAYAITGDIPHEETLVKLMTPILGRYYYPHGVEYDDEFPDKIVNKCNEKLKIIDENLQN